MADARAKERLLKEAAAALNTEPDQLPAIIEKFQRELKEIKESIAKLQKETKDGKPI
jgi:alanyl-tRNA synthetase